MPASCQQNSKRNTSLQKGMQTHWRRGAAPAVGTRWNWRSFGKFPSSRSQEAMTKHCMTAIHAKTHENWRKRFLGRVCFFPRAAHVHADPIANVKWQVVIYDDAFKVLSSPMTLSGFCFHLDPKPSDLQCWSTPAAHCYSAGQLVCPSYCHGSRKPRWYPQSWLCVCASSSNT